MYIIAFESFYFLEKCAVFFYIIKISWRMSYNFWSPTDLGFSVLKDFIAAGLKFLKGAVCYLSA